MLGHVPEPRAHRDRVVGNGDAAHVYRALRRAGETEKNSKQRRLPGTIRAHHANATIRHLDRQRVERGHRSVPLGERVDAQQRHGIHAAVWPRFGRVGARGSPLKVNAALDRQAIASRQLATQPVRDRGRHRWDDEEREAKCPEHGVHRQSERRREHVGRATEEADDVERQRRDAERGAHRTLTGAVAQVVLGAVAGDARLEERPDEQQSERDAREQHRGKERVRDLVAEGADLPPGHDAQRTVEPAHVPVRLRSRRHLGRVERAVDPDRIDLRDAAEQAQHRRGEEEQPEGLGRVRRPQALADHVVLGAAGPFELRVLVAHHDPEVQRQQHDDQRGNQQHVDDVEPREDVGTGELAAEQQRRQPRPRERNRQRDRVGDAQPGAGQLIVEQRVAGEAVEDGEDEQRHADHPVDLARPAERAGEEHPAEVDHDRRQEQQRGPVVDLAHHEPGARVEAQVDGRLIGLRHAHARSGA